MRIFILILLLAVCANAGFFNSTFSQKVKETFGKIKNALGGHVLAIREKLNGFKEKIAKKLTLSPERKAKLAKMLQSILRIKRDHVSPKGDSLEEVNEKTGVAELLFQGDMVLTDEQAEQLAEDVDIDYSIRAKRQAYRNRLYPSTIWPTGVNYFFHYNANEKVKSVFRKGAKAWEKDTCIDFRENSAARDSIRVFVEEGCWSFVGRIHGVQNLSLGAGCETVGTAAHEIGHALGFFHTHARHDRDDYIMLNTRSIVPKYLDQFDKQSMLMNDNYGIAYDYGSIMHYGATSGTINGQPTMVPIDGKYLETLGSHIISFNELLMMNTHYGCTARCKKETSANCTMGGFPHPRDCSKCICPSGYGGRLCNERPSGCGEILEATTTPQRLHDTLGDVAAGPKEREDFMFCNYWIKAPEGSKVEVTFLGYTNGLAIDGCVLAGVEIKTQEDQRLTGYRLCSPDDGGLTLISSSNIVPIITYNRFYRSEVVLEYRIAPEDKPQPPPQPQPQPKPDSRCRDSAQCETLVKYRNFCTSKSFTEKTKRELCPVSCKLDC